MVDNDYQVESTMAANIVTWGLRQQRDPLLKWLENQYPEGRFMAEKFGQKNSKNKAIPSIILVKMAPSLASGRRLGSANYGKRETQYLLNNMERVLPIGSEEWKQVLDEHTAEWPGREIESIRRKYSSLYQKQIPTGDPNMPDDVRQAKRIKHKIGDKAMIGNGEDNSSYCRRSFSLGNTPWIISIPHSESCRREVASRLRRTFQGSPTGSSWLLLIRYALLAKLNAEWTTTLIPNQLWSSSSFR